MGISHFVLYPLGKLCFVAVSLVALIASGLVYAVGVTRLGVSYNKSEIIAIAGKKELYFHSFFCRSPSFIARIIDFFTLGCLHSVCNASVIIVAFGCH